MIDLSGARVPADDPWNRKLLELVRPPDWENPRPKGRYNLVVVGGGTAGLVAAASAAGLGAQVALVERSLLGGDCLNHGCVPSKGILSAARVAHVVQRGAEFGVRVPEGAVHLDFTTAMERLRRLRASIAHHDSAHRFRDLGVDVFLGTGRFTSPDTLDVGGATLRFHRALIATGARAHVPTSIEGLQALPFLTNESVFELTELPSSVVIVGAGPIGCEVTQALARFGARVTLVDREATVLPKGDPDAGRVIAAQFESEGIELVLDATVETVRGDDAGMVLDLRQKGQRRSLRAAALLISTGRAANVASLGLEAAGVAFDRRGVQVDDRLRTTNRRIFAAGDVCTPMKFTHAADAMARIALQNALFLGRKRVSNLVIPWVTYTDPEVAHVGLTARQAADMGDRVTTLTVDMEQVDRAVLEGRTQGFARLHVESQSGQILGATLVSAHAGEAIGEVAVALTAGLKASALASTVHPYPTQAEVWKRLGDLWMRRRLTPRLAGLLRRFLTLSR
jgi:pyruvate/2-oxoglutarate dehydrogenase complex dihydrolipoamide dehydrogenase (E3) component